MTRIGRYEVQGRLGGGGMAEVFLADLVGGEGFSRPVAIKRVLPHLADDPAFVQMFVSEAQLCAKLQHPNIVSVMDFARDEDGRPYLVLELVDGPSLSDLVSAGPIPPAVALHVAAELLRALAYAHELPLGDSRGLVHRDISPHNVLLSKEGAVKLSDFGIAKARAATNATASELLKGKPSYMSPEQANGEALDGRSDLFAVGIVLWEMLVGQSLFSGQTTEETLSRVLFAPIPSPRSVRGEVPADLDRAVMHLLERERSDRPARASDALEELVACRDAPRDGREQLCELITERVSSTTAPLGDAATVRSPARALPPPRARQSRTWIFRWAGLLTLVVVTIVCTFLLTRSTGDSTRPPPSTSNTPTASEPANDPWNGSGSGSAGQRFLPASAYPDFVVPPGWEFRFFGKQPRLFPSGAGPRSNTAIIVEPLLPRNAPVPAPGALLDMALDYEIKLRGMKLLAKRGPYPTRSDYGLAGYYWEVRLDSAIGIENRIYAMLVDEYYSYGLDFTASDEEFDVYQGAFWKALSSVKARPPPANSKPQPLPQTTWGE